MKKSLFSKIFFTQIFVNLIVIILIIPTLFFAIGGYFVDSHRESILQEATKIAQMGRHVNALGKDKKAWDFFRSGIEFASGQSYAIVTDADGNVIAAPKDTRGVNLMKINKNFIKSAMEGRSMVALYPKGIIFNEQTLVSIVPIQENDALTGETHFLGAAIAYKPMPQIRHIQNRIISMVLMVHILGWVIAFVVAFILTRQIVKPVKRMRDAAKSIAAGNFEQRIPVKSNDEIGELSRTFNSMTQSLSELENMRSSFISDVSHELRTPMTIISGFVEGILDGTVPEEDREKYLSTVLEEIKRLSRLVSELLEASRLEQGKVELKKESVDINRLLLETVFANEQRLGEKKINLDLKLDETTPIAFADKDSIKRVLINLIDNAIKFTPNGGDILLATLRKNKKVYVSIKNSGEGISSEDLRHIWERFYKTDKSRSGDKKGVGLGLHIVKTIISQHGGQIYAQSEEGKSTTFVFVLDEA
ncbi:MAG: HAMP domain-containing protein [Clostridia bacterium]|nr:HAMP domain-containing protein [Clostridia bacterium]